MHPVLYLSLDPYQNSMKMGMLPERHPWVVRDGLPGGGGDGRQVTVSGGGGGDARVFQGKLWYPPLMLGGSHRLLWRHQILRDPLFLTDITSEVQFPIKHMAQAPNSTCTLCPYYAILGHA